MASKIATVLVAIVAFAAIQGTSASVYSDKLKATIDGFSTKLKAYQNQTQKLLDNAIKTGDGVVGLFNQSIQDGVKEIQKIVKQANDTGIAVDDCTKGLSAVGQAISKNLSDANTQCSKNAQVDLQPDIDIISNDTAGAQKAGQEAMVNCLGCGIDMICHVVVAKNLASNIAKYSIAIPKDIATLKIHVAEAVASRALCEGKALSSAQQSIKAAVDSVSSCVSDKTNSSNASNSTTTQ